MTSPSVSCWQVRASTQLSRSKTVDAYVIRLGREFRDDDEARSVILDANPCIVCVSEQHADSGLADVPCGMHVADLYELSPAPVSTTARLPIRVRAELRDRYRAISGNFVIIEQNEQYERGADPVSGGDYP